MVTSGKYELGTQLGDSVYSSTQCAYGPRFNPQNCKKK